jgi:hypothetical protein
MKTKLILCLCSLSMALVAVGQSPPPSATTSADALPAATAAASAAVTTNGVPTVTVTSPAVTVVAAPPVATAPSIAPSPGPANDDDFDRAVERKVRRHFDINFDGDHGHHGSDDVPWVVIPIVLIVFATPVLIVATILYFSFSNRRALHKTVRMLVEKGQPVPEALLNPPPVIRQRSDLRRGVVLLMVGAGLMVFFGAVNDWEGGVWSIGIVPFLIGFGYLLVWRLDVRREPSSPKV